MKKEPINKQVAALKKVCDIYWKKFRYAQLKHDNLTPTMKVYSSGEDYICFATTTLSGKNWEELSYVHGSIGFKSNDISKKTFDSAIRLIRRELKASKPEPSDQTKALIQEKKGEIKRKREELKQMQDNLKTSL